MSGQTQNNTVTKAMESTAKGEEQVPLLLETKQEHAVRKDFMWYIMSSQIFNAVAVQGCATISAIYFLEGLHVNETTAVEIVHFLMIVGAASQLIGSLVSESFMGDYITTLFFYIVGLSGLILLTISTIADIQWKNFEVILGFILFELGFAARPSFITFGCNQIMRSVDRDFKAGGNSEPDESRTELITKGQQIATQQFFSAIFIATKIGCVAGALVTPQIRFYSGGSYFLVFLMCALAELSAILAFWAGKNHYYFEKDSGNDEPQEKLNFNKPQQNSADCLSKKSLGTGLYRASQPTAEKRTKEDWKTFLSAALALTPVVVFSALELQTLSTWVFQARSLNGTIFWLFNYTIPPDQMQVLIQILPPLAVPILDKLIYPFVDQNILRLTSLRKVAASILLATLSFLSSGVLQIAISRDQEISSTPTAKDISILWQLPQYVVMAFAIAMMMIPRQEFAYHESPDSMKSAVNGVMESMSTFGSLVTIVIIALLGPSASKVEAMFVFAIVGTGGTLSMAFFSEMYVCRRTRG